jgi:16S rRNA (guanine966-N2)-methyltransferase
LDHKLGGCVGAVVLDCFAGSGALGIEALSRGAARTIFIESDPAALDCIRGNLESVGADPQSYVVLTKSQIHRWPSLVLAELGQQKISWVFADPPYEGPGLSKFFKDFLAEADSMLTPLARTWVELSSHAKLPPLPNPWVVLDHRLAGDAQAYWLTRQIAQPAV